MAANDFPSKVGAVAATTSTAAASSTPSVLNRKRIVLCGIVKNESKIIERNIASASSILDGICICDTGSEDNTRELIEAVGAKAGLPTKVSVHQWKNFGHNRTESFEALRAFVEERKWDPRDTYGLLLDADMILEISPSFDKQALRATHYMVKQYDSALSYDNVRLVRCDLPWRSIGVTHEYWGAAGQEDRASLSTLRINDVGDGGCKADKFERDIRLLTQGLIEEPSNMRYAFYLANSYKNSGKPEKAIEFYNKRITMGGWEEEIWYSRFMIGECYEAMAGKEEGAEIAQARAVAAYLEAFNYRPSRAEPLYKLARLYRLAGKNALGFHFAEAGGRIPYPTDTLFVSDPVYAYGFTEEKSITGYYVPGKKKQGFAAADSLVRDAKIPCHAKAMALKNIKFYLEPLSVTAVDRLSLHPKGEIGTVCRVLFASPFVLIVSSTGAHLVEIGSGETRVSTVRGFGGPVAPEASGRLRQLLFHRGELWLQESHKEKICLSRLVAFRRDCYSVAATCEIFCSSAETTELLLPPDTAICERNGSFRAIDVTAGVVFGPAAPRTANAPETSTCSLALSRVENWAPFEGGGCSSCCCFGRDSYLVLVWEERLGRFLVLDKEGRPLVASLPFKLPSPPPYGLAVEFGAFSADLDGILSALLSGVSSPGKTREIVALAETLSGAKASILSLDPTGLEIVRWYVSLSGIFSEQAALF